MSSERQQVPIPRDDNIGGRNLIVVSVPGDCGNIDWLDQIRQRFHLTACEARHSPAKPELPDQEVLQFVEKGGARHERDLPAGGGMEDDARQTSEQQR